MKVSTENIINTQHYLMELSSLGGMGMSRPTSSIRNRFSSAGNRSVGQPNQYGIQPKQRPRNVVRYAQANTKATTAIPAQKTSWGSRGH